MTFYITNHIQPLCMFLVDSDWQFPVCEWNSEYCVNCIFTWHADITFHYLTFTILSWGIIDAYPCCFWSAARFLNNPKYTFSGKIHLIFFWIRKIFIWILVNATKNITTLHILIIVIGVFLLKHIKKYMKYCTCAWGGEVENGKRWLPSIWTIPNTLM